jgi:hypothetical protein
MIKNKLVGFGDSWTQGSELPTDGKSFSQLVSEQLECVEYKNYGIPASSINHLTVQLQSHINRVTAIRQNTSEWIAVFFLTECNRAMTYCDGHWIFLNASADGGFGIVGGATMDQTLLNKTNTAYWKYIHSPELVDVTVNTTVLALQSMCRYHNIADYYVAGWQTFNFWPEVDINKIYQGGQINCGDLIGMQSADPNSYLNRQNPNQAPGGHPNQQGHQLIADALYKWIAESCAISKNLPKNS